MYPRLLVIEGCYSRVSDYSILLSHVTRLSRVIWIPSVHSISNFSFFFQICYDFAGLPSIPGILDDRNEELSDVRKILHAKRTSVLLVRSSNKSTRVFSF